MIVLQSMPALAAWLAAVLLAFARRRGGAGPIAAFFSLLCTAALMLFALVCGASMHEALAYLLFPLFLLLPKEKAS